MGLLTIFGLTYFLNSFYFSFCPFSLFYFDVVC